MPCSWPSRSNGANRRSRSVGVDPVAGVPYRDRDAPVRGLRAHDVDGSAAAVVLRGVGEQVQQDLKDALPVGEEVAAGLVVHGHRHVVLLGERSRQVDRLDEQVLQADRLERERELAGLDPRDVEQLGDQLEQVASRAQDLAHVVLLLAFQAVQLEQLGEAEDRVHRRAQLVADPGEEVVLGPVRALRVLLGGVEVLRALGDALLELARVALELVVEPRVLDRRRGLSGQRLHPVDVVPAERAGLRALDGAQTDDVPGRAQRHADPAPHVGAGEQRPAVGIALGVRHDHRLPLLEDASHDRPPAHRAGVVRGVRAVALAVAAERADHEPRLVGEEQDARARRADEARERVEQHAHDLLEVERARERLVGVAERLDALAPARSSVTSWQMPSTREGRNRSSSTTSPHVARWRTSPLGRTMRTCMRNGRRSASAL